MGGYYTGIGSRDTPEEICKIMTKLAKILEEKNYVLRSGGAEGADIAFEKGVKKLKNIYLPWKGFNNSESRFYNVSEEAKDIAEKNHPGWEYLKPAVKKLMGRNAYQVLGLELNKKSDFLICWTKDGCESDETRTSKTGGTGLAISIASKEGIPIFNLKNKESLDKIKKMIEKGE